MMKEKIIRVVLEVNSAGLWTVTRERKENGERATGLRSLEECLEYVKAHENEVFKTEERKNSRHDTELGATS